MCETIRVDDEAGTHFLDCVGHARAFFKAGVVFDADCDENHRPSKNEECLCHVDMEATAAKNGYAATNQHGGDPFEWVMSRSRQQPIEG